MGISTSTGTLTAGQSRTFDLAPASAVTLTLLPNARVTITESPATVAATGLGGNATRVHEPRLPGTFTYGPYPMGGTVVVENESNSGSTVSWTETSAVRDPLLPLYGVALFEPGDGQTLTTNAGAGATLDASGVETIDGEEWRYYTITATAGSSNYVEANVPAFLPISADSALLQWRSNVINSGISATVYLGTTSYATAISSTTGSMSAASSTGWRGHTGTIGAPSSYTEWTKSGFSRDSIEQAWTIAKVRMTVPNGSTVTIRLRSLHAGLRRRKGRLAVVADDGAASFFGLGMQILNRYGIPATAAIIADRIGATSYFTTEARLRSFVDAGNMCVAHGPVGGSGNLFSVNATDAAAIADMQANRDWLVSRKLTNARGAQCYVWPQGEWTRTDGDPAFLDLAWSAGFRVGRLANVITARYVSAAAVSAGKHNLLLNTLGHRYAGAASTADDADETTNIDAIVARMQYVAAAGLDSILVLHEVVARGAATTTIQIETDRLQTLAAAAQTLVAAGTLECITMDALTP